MALFPSLGRRQEATLQSRRTIFWHSAGRGLKAEVSLPFLDIAFSLTRGGEIVSMKKKFWDSAVEGLKAELSLPVLVAAFLASSENVHHSSDNFFFGFDSRRA